MNASRKFRTRVLHTVCTSVALTLVLTACGGSDGESEQAISVAEPPAPSQSEDSGQAPQAAAEGAAPDASATKKDTGTATTAEAPAAAGASGATGKGAADTTATVKGADKPASSSKDAKDAKNTAKDTAAAGGAKSGGASTSKAAEAPCKEKLSPLVIGQVGTFSGLVGQSIGGMKPGLAVWAQDINARGGIQCHPVQLFQVDDQNDPQKAAAAAEDLINNKKVQAIVGANVPLTMSGLRRTIKKYNMPVVGGDGIDGDWQKDPLLFPQGGTPLSAFGGAPAAVREALGFTKVALMYCVEAAICTLTASSAKAKGGIMDLAGVTMTNSEQVTLTQPDYTAACQNAKNSGAQFLMVLVDAAAMRRVANSCKNIGFKVPIAGTAIDFTAESPKDKNLSAVGVYATAPVAPFPAADTAALKAFHAAYERYLPGQAPDTSAIEGWSAGKLLEKALAGVAGKARAGDITTALIFDGLYTLKDETVDDLGPGVTFVKGSTPKLKPCYYVLTIKDGAYRAPFGSKKFCFSADPAER